MKQHIDLLQRVLDLLNPRKVALHRLERRSLIKAHSGTSDNNRRTKYYELTRAGRRQLDADQRAWEKLTAAVDQVLRPV